MRKMPVVGEPMGIEAAEKPLVGTPGGDPRLCAHFSLRTSPSAFPQLSQRSSLPSAESYKSSEADRIALYHIGSFLSSSLRVTRIAF